MSKVVFAAMAVTASMLAPFAQAQAQQTAAAQTSGGDVTADEATPLPPVVVTAPKERERPSRRRPNLDAAAPAKKKPTPASGPSIPDAVPFPDSVVASGEGDGSGKAVGIFTLGQLDLIGGSTITNEAMWTSRAERASRPCSTATARASAAAASSPISTPSARPTMKSAGATS